MKFRSDVLPISSLPSNTIEAPFGQLLPPTQWWSCRPKSTFPKIDQSLKTRSTPNPNSNLTASLSILTTILCTMLPPHLSPVCS